MVTWKQMLVLVLVLGTLGATLPALSSGGDAGGLEPLTVDQRFDTRMLDTMRIQLPYPAERMQRLGDVLAAVMIPPDCRVCETRNLALFIDGHVSYIEGVDAEAINARRVLQNGGRVLWAKHAGNSNARYDVFALNPETGVGELVFDDLFLGSSKRVDVFANGNRFYFAVEGSNDLGNGLPSVTIKEAYAGSSRVNTVGGVRRTGHEEIQDMHADGSLITRVTFSNGDQELWLHEGSASRAIQESYTINGYLLGAQFVGDDIEFFRYQQLMHHDRDLWKTTEVDGHLAWLPNEQEQRNWLAYNNGITFFVAFDEERRQHVVVRRKSGISRSIGGLNDTGLHIVGNDVLFRQSDDFVDGIVRYSLMSGLKIDEVGGLMTVDTLEDSVVGIDHQGTIHFERGDETVRIGYGRTALLGDATHVYWIGDDGLLRLTTVKPTVWMPEGNAVFAKVDGERAVYLLLDGKRYTVLDQQTYFTWRESYDSIRDLALFNTNAYIDAGAAPFAPGTLMRTPGRSTVYIVLNAREALPLVSEAEAQSFYGHGWWEEVLWVDDATLNRYETLDPVSLAAFR